MSRRFVMFVRDVPVPIVNAITLRFKEHSIGFWKRMDNAWLISSDDGATTAMALTKWVQETPGWPEVGKILVLRVDSGSTEYWGAMSDDEWSWFTTEWS